MRRRYRGQLALVCDDLRCGRRRWVGFSNRWGWMIIMAVLWLTLIGGGLLLSGCVPKNADRKPNTQVTCEPAADSGLQVCWGVK